MLLEMIEYVVVQRFDSRDDEDAAKFRKFGKQLTMLKDMFDFDRRVECEPGKLLFERSANAEPVRWSVKEIGIAKGDVSCAGVDFGSSVGNHGLASNGKHPTAVDRRDRTMGARMVAAASRLDITRGNDDSIAFH